MGRAEQPIEHYLCKRIEGLGGTTRKVVYQGRNGSPDRWCFLPGGKLLIVECKASGKKPDRQQSVEIAKLVSLGQIAVWVDSTEAVDALLKAHAN